MSDMVSVPAEKIAALREARKHWSPLPGEPLLDAVTSLLDAVETEDEPWPMCECRHFAHPDGPCPEWNHGPHPLSRKRYCLCRKYRPAGRCTDTLDDGRVQCEREWGHKAESPDPINWHRSGIFIWNTPTRQYADLSTPVPTVNIDTPAPSPARDDAESTYEAAMKAWAKWGVEQVSGDVAKEGRLAFIAGYKAAHMAAPDELTALRERVDALTTAARLITEDPGMNCHPGYEALRALLGDA